MARIARCMLLAVVVSLMVAATALAQGPIKIGFLSPLSGAIAAAGKDMYAGCELYWQENGWQMAGRKVEVVLEDNEGNPATTLTKARKLVENDHVHMLAGVILSNVAYALVPYVEQQGIPTIYPINSANDRPSARGPSGSSAPASRPAATCIPSGSRRRRPSATGRLPWSLSTTPSDGKSWGASSRRSRTTVATSSRMSGCR